MSRGKPPPGLAPQTPSRLPLPAGVSPGGQQLRGRGRRRHLDSNSFFVERPRRLIRCQGCVFQNDPDVERVAAALVRINYW